MCIISLFLFCCNTGSTPATPVEVTVPQTTVCTKPGNTVTIHCTVSGTLSSGGVLWKLGDNTLPSNERYSVDPVTNSLTITNVALSDVGVYKCTAMNHFSDDSATVHLNMTCKRGREREGEGEGGRWGRGRGRGRVLLLMYCGKYPITIS